MLINAIGTYSASQPLESMAITRRDPGPQDVQIAIAYCGVCHSDLHQARSEWAGTLYPCVPGHEIVGRVTAVGNAVSRYAVGDLVLTYNGPTQDAPGHTLGGYSQQIVVNERYVLRITHPEAQLAAVAPLLCAGITTYSPLRHWHVGPGKKVGVVGIGGLGHMGIKLAHAMGAHVVAFTTSESKRNAARALGADDVVVSRNEDEMAAHVKSFDFILNTVAAPHNLDAFTTLLKRDGTMTLVGAPATPHPSPEVFNLIFRRRSIAGSMIGGIPETQEMLDFCAEHGIVADIELIRGDEINEAWERMVKGDVKYRFVIDSATLAG
ncbi:oxidoreductase, zinc-binding dehydrogenase family [Klebsiella pneumoniae]|nr:oxidoreductase, zinc-binding dehydrogenase family [Klebsiella pneumoniae]